MKVAIILCCLFAVALAAKSGGKAEAKPAESKADAGKADAKAAAKADMKAESKSSAAAAAAAAAAKNDENNAFQAPVKMVQPETKTNVETNEYLSAQEQEAKKNNVYAPTYDARPVSYGPTYNAPAPPAYRPPVSNYNNNQNSYTVPQYGHNNAYHHNDNYNNHHYPPNDCKKTAILRKINEKVSKALENSKTACANVELLSNVKSLVNLALLNNCNNGYKAEGQHHQEKMAAAEGQQPAVEHQKKSFQSKSSSKKNFHSKSA